MPKINKVTWGNVWVDDQKHHQVLIAGNQVYERESDRLHELFGTTHELGDWEEKLLLSGQPEVILIANGWDGALKVKEELKRKIEKIGIELKIILTGQAGKEYERLVKAGKKVNALIHTTC